jgi:Protein of unknown function (DUF559)
MTDVGRFDAAIRNSNGPRGWGVVEIAERQHGVVAHHQLIGVGFRPTAIQRGVAAGRLHRLHLGVYAVGHRHLSREGRWMAAVLACGPRALLSHQDAATLLGLLRTSGNRVHVTAGRPPEGHPGIVLHRSRRIHPEDREVEDGIQVTSVPRTLLDLAESVPQWLLGRAIDEAERRGLFDLRALDRLIERSHGRHGLRQLRAALRAYRPIPFTRSELERRFLDLCRQAGLPAPSVNLFVEGMEVDFVWPEQRVVVELDSQAHHRTTRAFEEDRRRDATLQVAGYRVLRVTHHRLEAEPLEVVREIRALLDRV